MFEDMLMKEEGSRSQTQVSVKSNKTKKALTPDEEASFNRLEKMVSLRGIVLSGEDDLLESTFEPAVDIAPVLGQD